MQFEVIIFTPLVRRGLEIPRVVNAKLIGTKKNKEILGKYLEIIQTHYTVRPSDENARHFLRATISAFKIYLPS